MLSPAACFLVQPDSLRDGAGFACSSLRHTAKIFCQALMSGLPTHMEIWNALDAGNLGHFVEFRQTHTHDTNYSPMS